MSYERRGGGGYRRRYKDDYDDRRREVYESPEEILRAAVIKLGEVDVLEELPRLAKQIRDHVPLNLSNVSEALRVAVTEQPYKIPFYAALIQLLHEPPSPEDTTGTELPGPSLGRQILEDYWKGFQAYLDKLAWREARFSIHFFAHLVAASLVSPSSMAALLQSFTAVLDEFGVSYARAKKAALCAAEGLMICGGTLEQTNVNEIIGAIEAFGETTKGARWLVSPMGRWFGEGEGDEGDELLETLLTTLRTLSASNFIETAESFPQPYLAYSPPSAAEFAPFDLPSVLVPPEVLELDGGLSAMDTGDAAEDEVGEGQGQVKKEEWPEVFVRLFDNEVTPDPTTPPGYAIRSALLAITDIFEVNRKECARLLLEYPKWSLQGTFKPKPGAPPPAHEGENGHAAESSGREWQLESTIIETILNALLALPSSSQKSVYYVSLITELCKLSPSTVGPAVGKSIRRVYSLLSEGLDVEMAKRLAEWFAVHMSNFGFGWVWKEWIPDLTLSVNHPKRTFMRHAVELEVRLSYHDRILKTLPPAMQGPEAVVISEQAPGPDYEYDDPAKPHHDAAQSILNLFRGRAKAEDVISHLDTLKTTLLESSADDDGLGGGVDVDKVARNIAVQSLLHVGARSFSHLLNAIERYLPLLRSLAGISDGLGARLGKTEEDAKMGIMSAAARFWRGNRQMVGIVFDKLMQYQIVDPSDVVVWTFGREQEQEQEEGMGAGRKWSLSGWEWELVRGALDKANGRVASARRKVTALRKEEDDTRAREQAGFGVVVDVVDVGMGSVMEVDAEGAGVKTEEAVENPALRTALKAFATLTREQKTALSRVLDGFVGCLVDKDANPRAGVANEVVSEKAWRERAGWGGDEWNAWETWGWYRQFCRAYSPYLRSYQTTLWTVSFARFEGSTDPAVELLRRTWDVAVGQE